MSAEVVVDTNNFFRDLNTTDARRRAVAAPVAHALLANGEACISFQLVLECLNTALRKAQVAQDIESMRSFVYTVLTLLLLVPARPALCHSALGILAGWRFSFSDSLIVAAALTASCSQLLSADLQHGRHVEALTIHHPFMR
jgi:predicted nucleic acid-binding protein